MFWNLKKYLTFTFFSEQSSCREDVFSSSKDKKYPKGGKPGAGIMNSKTQGCSRHCSRYSRSNAGQVGAQFPKCYLSERCTNLEEICSHEMLCVCWYRSWHKDQPKHDKSFWSSSRLSCKDRQNDRKIAMKKKQTALCTPELVYRGGMWHGKTPQKSWVWRASVWEDPKNEWGFKEGLQEEGEQGVVRRNFN